MRNKSAFTIIELLVVIAIIGILASLIVIRLGDVRGRASVTSVKSDIVEAGKSIEVFKNSTDTNGSVILNLGNGAINHEPDELGSEGSGTGNTLPDIFKSKMNIEPSNYAYGTKIDRVRSQGFVYSYKTYHSGSVNTIERIIEPSCYYLAVSGLQSKDDGSKDVFAVVDGSSQDYDSMDGVNPLIKTPACSGL